MREPTYLSIEGRNHGIDSIVVPGCKFTNVHKSLSMPDLNAIIPRQTPDLISKIAKVEDNSSVK
jgi:hypothetical protein